VSTPASRIFDVVRDAPTGDRLVLVIKGSTIEGDEITKTVAVDLGEAGADGRKRLADAGLTLSQTGERVQIVGVKFGSRARQWGMAQVGNVARIDVPSARPTEHWFYIPALLLAAFVWWSQGRPIPAKGAPRWPQPHPASP